jgi:signal transduction histidine kinase
MIVWSSHLVIWFFLALAHLLLPPGLVRYSANKGKGDSARAHRVIVIYGGLMAVWALSGALTALMETVPAVGELAGVVFNALAPVTVGMAAMLERAFARKDPDRSWNIASSVWGVLVLVVGVYSWRSGNIPWASKTMAAFGWMVLWIALSVFCGRQYVQIEWAFQRNRALYWTWASVLLVIGQALALFAPWPMGAVGLLLHMGGLGAIAAAIIRRHLPNVRAALRQSFRFVVMALLTTALLLTSQLLLALFFSLPHAQPLQPAAVGLAVTVAVILAFLYKPLQNSVVRLAEWLVPHTGYDMDEELRKYSLAIANVIDLDQLGNVAVDTVSTALNVQRAALILVTEEQNEVRLRPLKGQGGVPLDEIRFDLYSPVIAHMGEQKPLFQHNLMQDTMFQNLLPKVQTWLQQQMGMEVYVPIFAQSTFIGILAVGPPRSGEPFGQRDRTFLTMLAHQTAVALQNARLFENMHVLNFKVTRLNDDLRRAMERVERLDQAKADFLSLASHELRTPLTHLKGYTDLLAELSNGGVLSPEQITEIVGIIGRATARLETIISAMTDISQIEEDELDTFFAPTTLKAVMRIALEPWLQPLQLRNLHLTVEGVEDIPTILVDLQRLSQAFKNLISNAIKYTPDGGTITVQAQQLDDERFKVVVSDTGVGVAPGDQDLIFDKFFRAGNIDHHSSGEFKFKGGGPGLGLSITRGIIEAHGGRIWVESRGYDEVQCPGSTFHIILPLEARSPVADSAKVPVL